MLEYVTAVRVCCEMYVHSILFPASSFDIQFNVFQTILYFDADKMAPSADGRGRSSQLSLIKQFTCIEVYCDVMKFYNLKFTTKR